jgi:hypothetical protein
MTSSFGLQPLAAGSIAAGTIVALGQARDNETLGNCLMAGAATVAVCELARRVLPRYSMPMRLARWVEPVPVTCAAVAVASIGLRAGGADGPSIPGRYFTGRTDPDLPILFGTYAGMTVLGVRTVLTLSGRVQVN